MVESTFINDELAVLGGPQEINVEVDFGPEGTRGSQIFANSGKPIIGLDGLTSLAPDCQLFDLYINILSSDDEYQYVYQLINTSGGQKQWQKLFKLVSNIYSHNYECYFSTGEGSINIPVVSIVPSDFAGTVTAANFNIQYNILNDNPLVSGMNIGEIVTDNGALALPITINAQELVDGVFTPLDSLDPKIVQVFITMV